MRMRNLARSLRAAGWIAISSGTLALGGAAPATAADSSFIWAGAAADSTAWSQGTNWVGGAAPSTTVDSLLFPPLDDPACATAPPTAAACASAENDLADLSVGALAIAGAGYLIGGQPIALGAGGLSITPPTTAKVTSLSLPISLTTPQTWRLSGAVVNQLHQNLVSVAGGVTGPTHALTIELANGSFLGFGGADGDVGPLTIRGADPDRLNPDLNGAVALFSTDLNAVSGNPVTVTDAALQATGAVGPLTLGHAALRVGEGASAGTLHAASATFSATSATTFFIYTKGNGAGVDYTQLTSNGAIALAGGIQVVDFDASCTPAQLGRTYTFVSTTGTLTGSYGGVPDGGEIPISPSGSCSPPARRLRIDYVTGSSPRTVTATVVAGSSVPDPPRPPAPPRPPTPPPAPRPVDPLPEPPQDGPPPTDGGGDGTPVEPVPAPPLPPISAPLPAAPAAGLPPAAAPPTATVALRAPRAVARRRLTASGIELHASGLRPGTRATATVHRRGRTLARSVVRVGRGGAATTRLTLSRSASRGLGANAVLSVRLSATAATGSSVTLTRTVRVR